MEVQLGTVQRDGATAAFLDGTSRGQLLLRRCRACGQTGGPQELQCAECCSTDTEAVPASGGAKVVSWSVVHGRTADGGTEAQAVVVIGELDEGPWWWTQLVGADPADVRTGGRLTVCFEPAGGGEALPVFRLV